MLPVSIKSNFLFLGWAIFFPNPYNYKFFKNKYTSEKKIPCFKYKYKQLPQSYKGLSSMKDKMPNFPYL